MRNDLIRAILDCGIDDLSMLDDAKADMFEIVDKMKSEGMELSLNNIMAEVFKEGIHRLGQAVKELRADLEKEKQAGQMSDESADQWEKLNRHRLNPEEDFGYYVNCLDTHLYFYTDYKAEKQEVYEELFAEELQALVDYTGFDIQW